VTGNTLKNNPWGYASGTNRFFFLDMQVYEAEGNSHWYIATFPTTQKMRYFYSATKEEKKVHPR